MIHVAESPIDKSWAGVASAKRLDDWSTHSSRNPGFPFYCVSCSELDALVLGYLPVRHVTYIADLFGDRTGVGVPSKRINDLSSGVDIHDEVSFVLALAHKRFDRAANFIPSRSNRPGIYLTPPRPLRRRFKNMALGTRKPP